MTTRDRFAALILAIGDAREDEECRRFLDAMLKGSLGPSLFELQHLAVGGMARWLMEQDKKAAAERGVA